MSKSKLMIVCQALKHLMTMSLMVYMYNRDMVLNTPTVLFPYPTVLLFETIYLPYGERIIRSGSTCVHPHLASHSPLLVYKITKAGKPHLKPFNLVPNKPLFFSCLH